MWVLSCRWRLRLRGKCRLWARSTECCAEREWSPEKAPGMEALRNLSECSIVAWMLILTNTSLLLGFQGLATPGHVCEFVSPPFEPLRVEVRSQGEHYFQLEASYQYCTHSAATFETWSARRSAGTFREKDHFRWNSGKKKLLGRAGRRVPTKFSIGVPVLDMFDGYASGRQVSYAMFREMHLRMVSLVYAFGFLAGLRGPMKRQTVINLSDPLLSWRMSQRYYNQKRTGFFPEIAFTVLTTSSIVFDLQTTEITSILIKSIFPLA